MFSHVVCDQVVDILKMSGNADFFSPEMDVIRYKDSDPGLDLLGALLAVSFKNICTIKLIREPEKRSKYAARHGPNCGKKARVE